jgi:hypothetical protein
MNQHVDFVEIKDSVHDFSDFEPDDEIVHADDNGTTHNVDSAIRLCCVNSPIRDYWFPILDVGLDNDRR